LIVEYEATIEQLIGKLSSGNHALAVKIASIPEDIRGYGHVKERSRTIASAKQAELMTQFESQEVVRSAA